MVVCDWYVLHTSLAAPMLQGTADPGEPTETERLRPWSSIANRMASKKSSDTFDAEVGDVAKHGIGGGQAQ